MEAVTKGFQRGAKGNIVTFFFEKIPLILRNPKNPGNMLEEPNTTFLMSDPPPIGAISDNFEIENILIAVDLPGQTSKMVYLHQKWIDFIT